MINKENEKGFTLIEVLLALAIIAIALTALLQSSGQSIKNTTAITNKNTRQLVSTQAISMIQLGLIPLTKERAVTEKTKLLDREWFWRANIINTPIPSVQQIIITTSLKAEGPFTNPVMGYRYDEE